MVQNSNNNSGGWFATLGSLPFGAPMFIQPSEDEQEPEIVLDRDGRDGCECKKCKDFFSYAIPNQEDKSFICWKCRHGI